MIYFGIYPAIYSAIYSAIYPAIYSAIYSAIYPAIYNAIYSAIYDAIYSAIYNAIYSAIYSVKNSQEPDLSLPERLIIFFTCKSDNAFLTVLSEQGMAFASCMAVILGLSCMSNNIFCWRGVSSWNRSVVSTPCFTGLLIVTKVPSSYDSMVGSSTFEFFAHFIPSPSP